MKRLLALALVAVMLGTFAACGPSQSPALTKVTLMLDWVPNTNHTGIFVAQEKGYFKDAGLDVNIIQPGEVYPEAAVASGAADFGISFQEYVTLSRAQDVPIVSIAAVIQHNTSGFASLADRNVTSPKDFAGLRYGSFGSPFEEPTIKALMEYDGGDPSTVKTVDTGEGDPVALLAEHQIDFAWVFYGWEYFQAKEQGIDLNMVMMKDYTACIPDYYTPVVIASEDTIANRPGVVRAFLKALSRGYDFAIQNPSQAADILVKAVPELDSKLVHDSQAWLSAQYQADAPRWGEQKLSVWQDYSDWMANNGVIDQPIEADKAFTNDFLP
jgi:ABC-type nitrate/sulfonate/bicarbonate transport system substrate-binding protein